MTEGQGTAADRGRPFFWLARKAHLKGIAQCATRPRWASSRNGRRWQAGGPGRASQASPNGFQSCCFDLSHIRPSGLEASSSEFTLPEPCEYDILLVCQHPHAL